MAIGRSVSQATSFSSSIFVDDSSFNVSDRLSIASDGIRIVRAVAFTAWRRSVLIQRRTGSG